MPDEKDVPMHTRILTSLTGSSPENVIHSRFCVDEGRLKNLGSQISGMTSRPIADNDEPKQVAAISLTFIAHHTGRHCFFIACTAVRVLDDKSLYLGPVGMSTASKGRL
jgi:hypothetical protein